MGSPRKGTGAHTGQEQVSARAHLSFHTQRAEPALQHELQSGHSRARNRASCTEDGNLSEEQKQCEGPIRGIQA